jgi:hybrid cluster-associated redox disulfide protein
MAKITKITEKTTLAKIIEKNDGAKILMENGVPCLACPMSQFEIDKLEIGEVCKMYGLNLDKILKELNK